PERREKKCSRRAACGMGWAGSGPARKAWTKGEDDGGEKEKPRDGGTELGGWNIEEQTGSKQGAYSTNGNHHGHRRWSGRAAMPMGAGAVEGADPKYQGVGGVGGLGVKSDGGKKRKQPKGAASGDRVHGRTGGGGQTEADPLESGERAGHGLWS